MTLGPRLVRTSGGDLPRPGTGAAAVVRSGHGPDEEADICAPGLRLTNGDNTPNHDENSSQMGIGRPVRSKDGGSSY